MTDLTTSEFEGFNKSNKKDLVTKTNQRRLIILEETVLVLVLFSLQLMSNA